MRAAPRPGGGPSPLVPLSYLASAAMAFLVAAAGVAYLAPPWTPDRIRLDALSGGGAAR